ncbi:IPT/TIG domain-containing protein [Pedobacter sp. MC2016-24]|uniref:IPT/TIG domain-containing protein n=1 Tax=Pedobacter sp. MC2016-24 TaxID=2780090 RepID=UPI001881F6C2|nr:IPT/TIG domain-containing protein [Pedobacter sp. MC2016-24]MBE9600882.1 IPT/TIG domain-containing protein [Pedobacter sp. MC2016-24]
MNYRRKFNTGTTFRILVGLLMLLIGACKKDKIEAIKIPLSITEYFPNSGNQGTLVTIQGTGFGENPEHVTGTFGGINADVVSVTPDEIVLRAPLNGKSGEISLKVNDEQVSVGSYTYQELSVGAISPSNGGAGTHIKISGAGFSSLLQPAQVFVNGKAAVVITVMDTLLIAEVPVGAGSGPVMVKVDGKEASGQIFKFQLINSIKPLSGGKGTVVRINGTGFEEEAAGNIVYFNGKIATVTASAADHLLVIAPDQVNTGPLSVTINGQKLSGPVFTVVAPPVIDVVTPLSGPKGSEMTISGALFSAIADENKVFINGIAIPVQSVTETRIKLIVPGGTGNGTVKVVVNDQVTEGPQFKDQNLGVFSVSPDNGLAGTTVTIHGSGFSTNAASNKVYFNGILAPVKTATENTIVLDAPTGLSTGDLKIVTGGQEALAPQKFRRAGIITLAGGPNSHDFGSALTSMALDNDGNIYVVDATNKVLKKITPDGIVSTLKSNGTILTFAAPYGIVIDKQNNIYVSDQSSREIRKITPSGQNTVYASGFAAGLMTFDNDGNMYANVSGFGAGMNRVTPSGNYSKVIGPLWPNSRTVVDAAGGVYFVDQGATGNNGISKLNPANPNDMLRIGSSNPDYVDEIGLAARFNGIEGGLALFGNIKMIAGDRYNYAIREVDIATRAVSTLFKLTPGFADGTLTSAKIASMNDLAVDKEGNIYILDSGNKAVRKVLLK